MDESIPGVRRQKKVLADGTIKYLNYDRATGDRLPDDPEKARAEVERRRSEKEHETTFADIIRAYCQSPEYTDLAPSTKLTEHYAIMEIEARYGNWTKTQLVAEGARGTFLDWHSHLAKTRPRAADARLGRMQKIFNFANDREILPRNPLFSFKRLYFGNRSQVIWLPEHFEALQASNAKPAMKWAAKLALHTGQRRRDLLDMKWDQFDGKGLTVTQSKSKRAGRPGRTVYIPATQELKAELDKLRLHLQAQYPHEPIAEQPIIRAARGRFYKDNAFRLAWEHATKAAKLPPVVINGKPYKLHFHDIRGTTVTLLAESGCNIPQIASITGHTLETVHRILEHYLKRTTTMAESAISMLEGAALERYTDPRTPPPPPDPRRQRIEALLRQYPIDESSVEDDQPDDSWLESVK